MTDSSWIEAEWPVPEWVRAGYTSRQGGHSKGAYRSLNLARHVADDPSDVKSNREKLMELLDLPAEPLWLNQIHGASLINAGDWLPDCEADAMTSTGTNQICVVLTADCLPLLLCDPLEHRIAAVHVGWRGFARKIIEQSLNAFQGKRENIIAWIGPHIHAHNYEVGNNVRKECTQAVEGTEFAFKASTKDKWLADLSALVRHVLKQEGVESIHESKRCVFDDAGSFYSYRRDGECGRMASMIWMSEEP